MTQHNPFAPPKAQGRAPDPPKKARSAARWMRVTGVLFISFGTMLLGLGVATLGMHPPPPVVAVVAGITLGAAFFTMFGFIGASLFRTASRLRRGFAEGSGAVVASAFVPLRRYFMFSLAVHGLGLLFTLWID